MKNKVGHKVTRVGKKKTSHELKNEANIKNKPIDD